MGLGMIEIEYKNINIIDNEIKLLEEEYNRLVAMTTSEEEKQKIENAKNRITAKLLKKYNKINEKINSINDDVTRVIIRYRMRGWTLEKIGDEIGYTKSTIFKKIEKVNKRNKK